jgi:ActR/RegA family two-component response regulator
MSETVLIVDDEEPVRRTFQDWLAGSGMAVEVIAVADAEAALLAANERPVDLAILDWNLGSGSDGLQLLEDLVEFHPDLIAILVTGYAAQATPLAALRHGIRDYLDKNHDLNRDTFLAAVRKQLDRIVPAKRQRALNASLAKFREAVEKVLPLVRAAATLNDPVPLPAAVKSLVRFSLRTTGANNGVLIVHAATTYAYDSEGKPLEIGAVPFGRTLAASALSLQEPSVMNDLASLPRGSVSLFPFEEKRSSVLAIPIPAGAAAQVVLELFDKPAFTDADRATGALVAEIGTELLRSAIAERQTSQMLVEAVEAALSASQDVSGVIAGAAPPSEPPPAVMQLLRSGIDAGIVNADLGLDLVAAVRELAVRHGSDAVQHCVTMVRGLRTLLDGQSA